MGGEGKEEGGEKGDEAEVEAEKKDEEMGRGGGRGVRKGEGGGLCRACTFRKQWYSRCYCGIICRMHPLYKCYKKINFIKRKF